MDTIVDVLEAERSRLGSFRLLCFLQKNGLITLGPWKPEKVSTSAELFRVH